MDDTSLETDLNDMEEETYEDDVAKVTSNGLYEKCYLVHSKQVPMFESEVHAEFTWPPRPVVEGESFRVSRAHLEFVKVLRIHQCPNTGQRKIVCTPSKSQQSYMVLC